MFSHSIKRDSEALPPSADRFSILSQLAVGLSKFGKQPSHLLEISLLAQVGDHFLPMVERLLELTDLPISYG